MDFDRASAEARAAVEERRALEQASAEGALDAALLLVMQKMERRTLALRDGTEAEKAGTQQDLALACRHYNQLVVEGTAEALREHKHRLLADEQLTIRRLSA